MLSSASDKAELFAENFSKNYSLDGSGISLPVLLSRTKKIFHFIHLFFLIFGLDTNKHSRVSCIYLSSQTLKFQEKSKKNTVYSDLRT